MSSSRVGSSISTTHSAAASPSLLASGIFATEPGQRLLLILEAFADRGFLGLYKKCSGNTHGDYYQTGLRRVHLWSNEVVEEDISHVRARCPDLDETYEACFVQYVGDRYRGRRRPTVQCPPVHEFARRFLESFGQHSSVCSGDFFTQRGDMLLRRMVCMDAARQALYALVTTENVRIELASEVSAAPRRLADATSEDLRARARPSPPLQSSPPSEIAPQDSISQVGARRQEDREDYDEERQSVVSARPARAESQRAGRREDTSKRSSSSTRERHSPSEEMDGRSVVAPSAVAPSAVAPSAVARSVARDLPPPTVHAPPSHVSVSSSVRRSTSAPSPPPRSRSPSPSPSPSPPPSPRYEEDARHKVHEDDDRHNFALSRDLAEEEEPVVVARPPKRMEEFTGTSRISSRDSSVSIGMKKARSPRH